MYFYYHFYYHLYYHFYYYFYYHFYLCQGLRREPVDRVAVGHQQVLPLPHTGGPTILPPRRGRLLQRRRVRGEEVQGL
jgi:hypothetical protein